MLSSVEERMRKFEICKNEVRQSNINTKIPMEIVNSLNEIIQESWSSAVVEVLRQQVVQNDWFVTDNLRGFVMDLHDKFDGATPLGVLIPTSFAGNPFPQTSRMRSEFSSARNCEERD